METRRLFDVYVSNINRALLGSSESTIHKIHLTNDEVEFIVDVLAGNCNKKWICIPGRAILKTDEIRRIVRVNEDDI